MFVDHLYGEKTSTARGAKHNALYRNRTQVLTAPLQNPAIAYLLRQRNQPVGLPTLYRILQQNVYLQISP